MPPLTGFGIGETMFDDDADTAVQALSDVFGTPSTDTGWVAASSSPFGTCPGEHVRGVRWGQLQTVYSDEGGAEHFLNYTYGLANREAAPSLRTDVGVGLGSTVAQVQAVYPTAQIGFRRTRGGLLRRRGRRDLRIVRSPRRHRQGHAHRRRHALPVGAGRRSLTCG